MKISDTGLAIIKNFEGLKLKAYQCSAGVWTIAWGHTSGVREGQSINIQTAKEYLLQDLSPIETYLNSLHLPFSQGQFDALCSLIFNIGLGAFKKSTLLKHIKAGRLMDASLAFLDWNKAGGKVLEGLKKRRGLERELFLS